MRCSTLLAAALFALVPSCGESSDEPDEPARAVDAGDDDAADDDDSADDDSPTVDGGADDDSSDDDVSPPDAGDDDGGDDDVDAGGDDDVGDVDGGPVDVPEPVAEWPEGITLIELDEDGHAELDSTFAGAEPLDALDWARDPDVGCWSQQSDDEFFSAEHVAFALAEPLPEWSEVTVTITPESGREANLYVIEMPATQADVPPAIDSATFCNVPVQLGSPGVPSSVTFRTYAGDTHVMFGVSHRGRFNGNDEAAFTVEVQATPLAEADRCYAEVAEPFKYPSNVRVLSLDTEGKLTAQGDLGQGAPVCDDAFLDDQFCAPTTRLDMFGGNHVFYAIEGGIPDHTVLSVTVIPDPGVDVSLYGSWSGTTNYYVPPNFQAGGCEASYVATFPGASVTKNPGEAESITLNAIDNPYNIFFAVAGTTEQGGTGGYTVSIDTLETGSNDCSEDDYSAVVGLEEWPSAVTPIPVAFSDGVGTASVTGDLADGSPQCTLDWAANSSVACFPLTQSDYFAGNHLFYALEEPPPPGSQVVFRAIPEPGVEVSLLAYRIGATNFLVPPYVPSVVQCEVSHNLVLDHSPNPGVVEEVAFYGGSNPYNFFVAVAGYRGGEASGAFRLEVEITEPPPPHCPESLPGATYPAWPANVERVEVDADGSGSTSGDLSSGSCVNLEFAANSSVACFPSTRFDLFEGNHVMYAVDELLPPHSELTVTVTPEPGVDVNVYGFQSGTTSFPVPPNVPSVPVCEASYPLAGGSNPGEAETLYFNNPTESNSYQVSFVVAGPAEGGTSGGYDIAVQLDTSTVHCEESLPGESGLGDWPARVQTVALDANGEGSVAGDVADGSCSNLGWASNSSVACFPETRFDRFDGNHQLYALAEPMPPNSILTLTLTPAADTDVNLYGYQIGATSYLVPPAVPSVVSCEASYPGHPFVDENPGEVEVISFYNPSETATYNILFAAAGPHGATAGGYTIEAQLQVGSTHCEESLPGQRHASWPGNVAQLTVGPDGLGSTQVSGDLADGACVNLAFAANSAVACFPATQDAAFQGSHVFHAFTMPPGSEATVTLDSANDVANLYGYLTGDQSFLVPPYVPSVISCEASLPPFTNPADDEIRFTNPGSVSRNVLFAVAGESGESAGAFNVTVEVVALP